MIGYVVIRYTGETKRGLTNGKRYAVETDDDYIDNSVFNDFNTYTVFNDKGHLHEIDQGDYEVIKGANQRDWFNARSEKKYIQLY
jgi:hypothetical protein